MKYFEEAKYIWINYVPKQGQSRTVQGELIRSVEKLRDEAQRNGNTNWDEGFEMFCDFLEYKLIDTDVFEEVSIESIRRDINRLRDFEDPYLQDDLYDRITDQIIEWQFKYPDPIDKPNDPRQYR